MWFRKPSHSANQQYIYIKSSHVQMWSVCFNQLAHCSKKREHEQFGQRGRPALFVCHSPTKSEEFDMLSPVQYSFSTYVQCGQFSNKFQQSDPSSAHTVGRISSSGHPVMVDVAFITDYLNHTSYQTSKTAPLSKKKTYWPIWLLNQSFLFGCLSCSRG